MIGTASRGGRVARGGFVVGIILGVIGLASGPLAASRAGGQRQGGPGPRPDPPPVHTVAGVRHGVSVFLRTDYPQLKPLREGEVDFAHYHSYAETTRLLKMWADRYPDLVDLYSVGQSFEGREIWQITLTNKKTGKDTDKPAFYLESGRHAGEISGIETTLYFINHLLTSYPTDPAIRQLVDTKTMYVRPHNNPDGNTLYHLTAQTLRSTVRPYDNDGDGLLDEDSAEDLDGDGYIRQMRKFVGEGKGNARKDPRDPSGRLMERAARGEGDYELYNEGVDSDGDGVINEDGIGGLDLHRNYPENWRPMTEATGRGYTQGGAGEYPLSEPETRAVFLFLMTHPNVAVAQSLDTSVPMILRGPSTSSSADSAFPDDLVYLRKFDEKGKEITGYPYAGDTFLDYSNRSLDEGEEPRGRPLFGHGPDFGYLYYGVVWYGDEIWNGGRFEDYDKDGRIDGLEVLRWNDEHRAGKGDFQNWTAFEHPTLGAVEIGGFNPKFYGQNPPADMIETWARNEAMFNLYLAQQLPQVKIDAVDVKPGTAAGTFDVALRVTNEGLLPTALDIAKRVAIVRPDTCTIQLARGQSLAAAAEGQPEQRGSIEIDWLEPGETKSVTWTVSGAGTATVSIGSTRGGVDRREVEIR